MYIYHIQMYVCHIEMFERYGSIHMIHIYNACE